MFETNWLGIVVLAAVIFFVAFRWQKKKEEDYKKADEARNLKHTSEPTSFLVKEALLVTLISVVGLLLLGIIRIEGLERGCSYSRYEGPDACYDEY